MHNSRKAEISPAATRELAYVACSFDRVPEWFKGQVCKTSDSGVRIPPRSQTEPIGKVENLSGR